MIDKLLDEIDSLADKVVEIWHIQSLSINFSRLVLVIENADDFERSLVGVFDFKEGMGMGNRVFTFFAEVEIVAD